MVPVMSMVSYSAVRTVYPVPARLRSGSNRSTDYPADNRATHHSAGYSARADTNGRIALSTGNVWGTAASPRSDARPIRVFRISASIQVASSTRPCEVSSGIWALPKRGR